MILRLNKIFTQMYLAAVTWDIYFFLYYLILYIFLSFFLSFIFFNLFSFLPSKCIYLRLIPRPNTNEFFSTATQICPYRLRAGSKRNSPSYLPKWLTSHLVSHSVYFFFFLLRCPLLLVSAPSSGQYYFCVYKFNWQSENVFIYVFVFFFLSCCFFFFPFFFLLF